MYVNTFVTDPVFQMYYEVSFNSSYKAKKSKIHQNSLILARVIKLKLKLISRENSFRFCETSDRDR